MQEAAWEGTLATRPDTFVSGGKAAKRTETYLGHTGSWGGREGSPHSEGDQRNLLASSQMGYGVFPTRGVSCVSPPPPASCGPPVSIPR